ncbi:phage holin family protein [Olsenella sp. AM04-33]|uniref:phage holin family protein n=1 Tax=Olsenella sp. AM04-33 TaxID=2292049 RepID=UPI000E5482F6|nr:phage holin family protein [Olsenella sp. AM04-33]RHK02499.1 phage holin family protein [Olsenella sp. AM04-33]
MRTLYSVLATTIASFVAVALVPSAHVIGQPQWAAYLAFALMLCVINAIVKPIIQVLSIPVTVLTLGLFSFVIDALMVSLASNLAANVFGVGVVVTGFWATLFVALIVSVVSGLLGAKD